MIFWNISLMLLQNLRKTHFGAIGKPKKPLKKQNGTGIAI
jgi:hypothetical protein